MMHCFHTLLSIQIWICPYSQGGSEVIFKYTTLIGSPAERSFEGKVEDNGNGTYSCTYTPQEAGGPHHHVPLCTQTSRCIELYRRLVQ